ncbi:uncharacterized short-chain type dehydrogenase/reductase y4vI-like [Mercenaria mercenaria]|uniref:uncharacterized short-chain type dehydrogenase/reductase y4vI-like n=1 Tax=Mercenaria mercenaria TaxID=6596 RepID=UPI00234E7975|nr:uncharacterized short-chain type dehydrogenase/reductase y4vI-like [Mercenaria mercenaria]
MGSLRGRVAIITGASSGIGEGVAIKFAQLGCRLAISGRNEDNLKRVNGLCREAGLNQDQILNIAGDIDKDEDRRSIVQNTIDKYGEINVLVNNAGMIHYNRISDITEEKYDEIFNTNVKSHVLLTQLVMPHLIKSKGNIVNTSSICGQRAMPEVGVYCMTKASMDMFTQCLALEMAPHGVRVNAINPGTIVSNIARRPWGVYQDEELYQKFLEKQASGHPLGRVGQPEDCAEAVAFLASDSASFITGQIMFLDGGRHCVSAGVATAVKKCDDKRFFFCWCCCLHLQSTGASSGIGEGVAIKFAQLGCRLVISGRNEDNLKRVNGLCREAGLNQDQILNIAGDINKEGDRRSIVQKTIDKYGEINVLVNNAGMNHFNRISDITEEKYDEIFNTNVKSHVLLTQLVIPHLIKSKGNIVNTSSICGQRAMPEVGVYCMTKASMDMFTQCLALEMAPHGVRVNAINPGTIVSNIARRPWGAYQDEELYRKFLEKQASGHPLGRVGQPEDCAEAVAFLASDSASFITGQIMFLDGGRHCVSAGVATAVKK